MPRQKEKEGTKKIKFKIKHINKDSKNYHNQK
jgi:hypothetical protein